MRAKKEETKCCDWKGCDAHGIYPAPKNPNNLQDRHWFCLAHVRQYNKEWNFFQNRSSEEIEEYMEGVSYAHRPTWKRSATMGHPSIQDEILKQVDDFFGESPKVPSPISDQEKKALDALHLAWPVEWKDIRSAYKKLAKKHHPDINKTHNEERFKTINHAYHFLKQRYKP